jgi:hypothetical protein
MSYTTCPGCGTELDGDVESRRYGTDEEIKRRLAVIAESDGDDDVCIDGSCYDADGFAIHDSHRCRARRKRPDCGHSRDCEWLDGVCGWCLDVGSVIGSAENATRELVEAMGNVIVEVLMAHRITEPELTAICAAIGEGTGKWMREDRERTLSALNQVGTPAASET